MSGFTSSSHIMSVFSVDLQPIITYNLSAKDKASFAATCKDTKNNLEIHSWKDNISVMDKTETILKDLIFNAGPLDRLQKLIISFYDKKGKLILHLTKTSYTTFYKLDDFMISPRFIVEEPEDQERLLAFLRRQDEDLSISFYTLTAFDMKEKAQRLNKRFSSFLTKKRSSF